MPNEALSILRDAVRCPTCGSAEMVYTCEPKCCFNHLCADCRTTFQLLTCKTDVASLTPRNDVALPESSDPTAACAACDSLRVYQFSQPGASTILACADCGAVLQLTYEEIAPA